jgi:membrane protein DedA with SNARE-associated domain
VNIFSLSFLDSLEDFFVSLLGRQVYLAPILLLILEESGLPVPVPGDIIIAFIGYEVSQGRIAYPVAFLMILCSVLSGATILYFVSARYGQKVVLRFGKYFHLNPEKLIRVEKHFEKYGPFVIIVGRHIPGFRVPITVFSGMSKVTYKTFILSTFISVIFWIAFYLEVGKQLGLKTVNLLKSNHVYYGFLFIGLAVFIGYLFFIYLKKSHYLKQRIKKIWVKLHDR